MRSLLDMPHEEVVRLFFADMARTERLEARMERRINAFAEERRKARAREARAQELGKRRKASS